jgi:hypothetical protein
MPQRRKDPDVWDAFTLPRAPIKGVAPRSRGARTQGVQRQSQGEMNLVSDFAARETIGALAYGKAVWSWHPLLVSSSRRQAGPTPISDIDMLGGPKF